MFNKDFLGYAAALLPSLIEAVGETVQAVQVHASDKSGEEKRKAAQEAANSLYDTLDKGFNLPESVDNAAKEFLIPGLMQFIYRGMKDTRKEGGADASHQ